MRDVTVRLPEPLIASALHLAQHRDATLGQVVRDAIAAEIRHSGRNTKTPNRAHEQFLAPLRVLLASDFARPKAGGGLALHTHLAGARMCKASGLGHALLSLMRWYGAPYPGHSHRHLADKAFGTGWTTPREPGALNVIEPF